MSARRAHAHFAPASHAAQSIHRARAAPTPGSVRETAYQRRFIMKKLTTFAIAAAMLGAAAISAPASAGFKGGFKGGGFHKHGHHHHHHGHWGHRRHFGW